MPDECSAMLIPSCGSPDRLVQPSIDARKRVLNILIFIINHLMPFPMGQPPLILLADRATRQHEIIRNQRGSPRKAKPMPLKWEEPSGGRTCTRARGERIAATEVPTPRGTGCLYSRPGHLPVGQAPDANGFFISAARFYVLSRANVGKKEQKAHQHAVSTISIAGF